MMMRRGAVVRTDRDAERDITVERDEHGQIVRCLVGGEDVTDSVVSVTIHNWARSPTCIDVEVA